jgi:hypothetical protein
VTATKFCKDCKFARKVHWFSWRNARCCHPLSIRKPEYFVSGDKDYLTTCSVSREIGARCGSHAESFEPRNIKEWKIFKVEQKMDGGIK